MDKPEKLNYNAGLNTDILTQGIHRIPIIQPVAQQESNIFIIYSLPIKNRAGRSKNKATIILDNFLKQSKKPQKKEFFNAFIIRSIKRVLRKIEKRKIPKHTSISVNLNNENEIIIWKKLQKAYSVDSRFYKSISKTDSGPLTDGKAKRKKLHDYIPKSFNNKYCKEFFMDEKILTVYYILVELLFSSPNPAQLIKRFKLFCCDSDNHSSFCYTKWSLLWDFLQNDYINSLKN